MIYHMSILSMYCVCHTRDVCHTCDVCVCACMYFACHTCDVWYYNKLGAGRQALRAVWFLSCTLCSFLNHLCVGHISLPAHAFRFRTFLCLSVEVSTKMRVAAKKLLLFFV